MKSTRGLIDWYFSKGALPYWCVLIIDCLIIMVSAYVVYWAFYRGIALQKSFWAILKVMLIYIAVTIVFFRIFKTYVGIIRFSSFDDLIRIGTAMICSYLVAFALHYPIAANFEWYELAHLTARVLFFIYALATCVMWLERMLIKAAYDSLFHTGSAMNVFVYGIMAGGIGLAKSIRGEKPMRFRLKGFISHDPSLHSHGTVLMGVPVFDVDSTLPDVLKRQKIDAVLVAPGRIDRFRDDQVLQEYIISSGVKIYFSQDTVEWDKESNGTPLLKEVSIEDLLARDEIKIDLDSVAADLCDRKVLITGAAGSIGQEIVRQVASFAPSEMVLIDAAETPQHEMRLMMEKEFPSVKARTIVANICCEDRMEMIFKDFCPDYVFHAAAYKHVPMMEDNPSESVQNNICGTKILADLSVKYGTRKFVMISTDKAVNPTNVMGCSKRICEIYVQSLDKAIQEGKIEGSTRFVTTRFGNVLGSNGSVIPIFRKQIMEGGPLTVTHPGIIRYFMLIPEACKLVLEAATKGEGGEIFVFDMGKPVKIVDLARTMIELSDAKGVEIKFTGLRDGEKLYEEVLGAGESSKPSFHEKIRIASVREYDYFTVEGQIRDLIAISHEYDDFKTVAAMKRMVPEYVSNHSAFSVLDKQPS